MIDLSDNETGMRMFRETKQVRLNCIRRKAVIGVEKKDVFTLAGAKTAVTRPRQAPILLPHEYDARITARHFNDVVRRTIIHYDNFHCAVLLCQRTFDRFRQTVRLDITKKDQRLDWHPPFAINAHWT